MEQINIEGHKKENVLIFSIKGRFDASSSVKVEETLINWIEQGENLLLGNLSNLDYISSSGIRILVMIAKKLNEIHGRLVVCGVPEHVQEVFKIVELSRIIPVADTEEDALRLFL